MPPASLDGTGKEEPMDTIAKDIRNAGLGEYADLGFSLSSDDHILDLWFKENVHVASFSATGATIEEIQKECKAFYHKLNTIDRFKEIINQYA